MQLQNLHSDDPSLNRYNSVNYCYSPTYITYLSLLYYPGTYNLWENWNSCSETCQSNSNFSPTQIRVRLCVGDNLGGGCNGNNQEIKNCNEKFPCPGSIFNFVSKLEVNTITLILKVNVKFQKSDIFLFTQ